jgi:hypothetical protein
LLRGQPEQLSDKADLTPNVVSPHPPNLLLPNHVHRLIALNGSPGGIEFSKTLLGMNSAFDWPMILFNDVIQILNGSMAAIGGAVSLPF